MLEHHVQGTAPDGLPFNLFTLQNAQGMRAQFTDWGATWTSCCVPVNGELREVLLGCKLEEYPIQQAYLGVSVGRYANRIANAQFTLNDKTVTLTANQGKHQLHGGVNGFDKHRWALEKCGENFVCFSLHSVDGDQGFPGNVDMTVTYTLTEENSVKIEYAGKSDQDTPLNLTNHAYFNLNDAQYGKDVREHLLQLNADYFLPVDSEGIPNAPLKAVDGTSFDFRREKSIGADFLKEEQQLTKGYDHSFLLSGEPQKTAAILTALDRSLRLEISTSQRALQVYTGNYLGGTPNRNGGEYADYAGVALETQALPDTPNHPEWQHYGGITKATEVYRHWTKFKFV